MAILKNPIGLLAGACVFCAFFCGCGNMGASDDYDLMREAQWAILDGDGHKKPWLKSKDFFTIYMESLEHPSQSIRAAAAVRAQGCAFGPARCYGYVLDGYIDKGPVKELKETLVRAWQKAEDASDERLLMLELLLDLKTRTYLWEHPDFAREVGAEMVPGRGGRSTGPELAIDRLLGEDPEVPALWREYQHLQGLQREKKLKRIDWLH